MKFQVNERVVTDMEPHQLLDIIQDQFKMIATSVKRDNRVVTVKGVESTFGSINRADSSEVTVRSNKGSNSRLIVVVTKYRPSVMFWILLILLSTTFIFWPIPIVFYLMQKNAVKDAITNCLRNVKNEVE